MGARTPNRPPQNPRHRDSSVKEGNKRYCHGGGIVICRETDYERRSYIKQSVSGLARMLLYCSLHDDLVSPSLAIGDCCLFAKLDRLL